MKHYNEGLGIQTGETVDISLIGKKARAPYLGRLPIVL
jgi:hypothetical protein